MGKGDSDEKPVHEVKNGYSFTVFRVGAAGVVGFSRLARCDVVRHRLTKSEAVLGPPPLFNPSSDPRVVENTDMGTGLLVKYVC